MKMEWSPESATNAYLDTLKLCSKRNEQWDRSCETNSIGAEAKEPESNEFISALAAGMNSKLIVEVTSDVSPSTVALAAAARQTGGKLVCILPDQRKLDKSQKAIQDSGLNGMVEFKMGDPAELLPNYENVDFSLVDCKSEDYPRLLDLLDVNPRRSVVVANNLAEGRHPSLGGKNKANLTSMTHPIGKKMEVTMIGRSYDFGRGKWRCKSERKCSNSSMKKGDKSNWVFRVDEKSGEEHIYRVPRSISLENLASASENSNSNKKNQ